MTLTQAQQAFCQTPNRLNALAYMDAAIDRWEQCDEHEEANEAFIFAHHMTQIRDWLAIPTGESK